MNPRLAFLLSAWFLLGCGDAPRELPPSVSLEGQGIDSLFSDDFRLCQANEDCVSGICDTSWLGPLLEGRGRCVGLRSENHRWQLVLASKRVAAVAIEDPEFRRKLMERIQKEWESQALPDDREALVILLSELPGEDSRALLFQILQTDSGSLSLLAGLGLAALKDPRGEDSVLDAVLSPVVRLRLHAAKGAGRLCSPRTQEALLELAQDHHPMVRDAAVHALLDCPQEIARGLLEEWPGATKADPEAGDRFNLVLTKQALGME